ncbi:T9SS type B sorting domain-containing protein [Halocola ammonii]
MCRSFFIVIAFVLISSFAKAQLATPEVIVEPVETHTGMVGGVDLSGFTTYRIYLNLESDEYILTGLFANPVTATQPEPIDIIFNSECEIYQDPNGEYLGSEIGCGFIPGFPALEFDSWLTIGMECNTDPGSVSAVYFDMGAEAQLETDFNEDNGIGFGTIEVNNGAIFALNDQPNTIPIQDADGNWKVLIAQITTCGNFELCFGAQIQEVVEDQPNITHTYELCATSPCDDNPIDVSSSSTNLSCFEDGTGTISTEVTLDGNGDLSFDLFGTENDEDTLLVEDAAAGDFTDLAAGDYIVVTTDNVGCMNYSDTLTITQPDELILDITQDSGVLCAGDETGELSVSATGGTGAYEYDFDNGNGFVSTTSIADLACGEYNITVRDENLCETTETEVIDCPEPIVIDMNANDVNCFGACDGSIEGTVTGGTGVLTYEWTGCDGFTSADLELADLCPCDSYQLVVTDENACQDSVTFEITEPLELTTTTSVEDVDCFGDASGQLVVIAEGGTGASEITCEDSNGFEVDNPAAVTAGTYICTTVDQNGCTVVDTLEVTQPDELVFTLDTTSISCFGYADGVIAVDPMGGTPSSNGYQISLAPDPNGPSSGPVFDSLPAGLYTVSVADSLGCLVSEEIEIFEPDGIQLSFETTSVSCNGGSDGDLLIEAEGGTDPITYEIESADDAFSNITGFFENLPATGYDVTVTDDNGCAVTDSVVVNEPDTLMASVLANVDVSCGGECDGAVLLDITGGTPEYEVIWNGDPQQMNDELCAGPNQVNITDAQGCTFAAEVIVNEPAPIQFLINTQNATCTGMTDGSANVEAIGGTGEISIDVGGIDLDNLAEGEYIVTAVDSVGCFAQDTIFMESNIESDLTLELFSSPVTCWNQGDGTATAAVSGGEGPISYVWNDEDEQTTATAVGLPEELYSVTVTDAQGCELSGSVEVEPTVGCFFIATAITPNSDGINDEWVIGGLEFFPNVLVQVYNRWGQLVFESRGYPTRWDGRFNGNRLPIADYYYVITFEESGLDTMTGTVTIKY